MEAPTRTLVQEKAILVARQGDPNAPAPGTLLARQKILHAELEAAHQRSKRNKTSAVSVVDPTRPAVRQTDQIRRDIRRIERELGALQLRLREIDKAMAEGADRRRN
jgi:hypothetical protein